MIIREEKTKNYTAMCNYALNDNNLSLKAKGLWAFIMTKPDGWNINYRGLASQLKEGQQAILAGLKELEDAGYLERGRVRNEKGQFSQLDGILYEKPRVENRSTDNHSVDSSRTKVSTEEVSTDKVNTEEASNTNVLLERSALLKPLPKQEFGNKDVNEVLNRFEQKVGLVLTRKAMNRNAAHRLIKAIGLDGVLKAIDIYSAVAADQFAPQISSIEELEEKWTKLGNYIKKKHAEQTKTAPTADLDNL